MRLSKYVPVVLLTVLAACESDPMGGLAELSVTTDQALYSVGDTVTMDIVNDSDRDAFFHHCNRHFAVVVQNRIGTVWTDALNLYGPACPDIFESGIEVVLSSSARRDVVVISESGTYRLSYQTGSRSKEIGGTEVLSNEFTIE